MYRILILALFGLKLNEQFNDDGNNRRTGARKWRNIFLFACINDYSILKILPDEYFNKR